MGLEVGIYSKKPINFVIIHKIENILIIRDEFLLYMKKKIIKRKYFYLSSSNDQRGSN